MLLDVLAGVRPNLWLQHGGVATLDSYGGSLASIPDLHLELLAHAVPYWESSSAICVHANLEPGVELAEQRPEWLRWQPLTGFEFPHPSGKRVVCGHTGLPNGLPMVRDGWVCLDTLAYTGRHLTCLNIDSGEILQANQSGEFREFHLNDVQV
jgi:serine/threonine protein phosphatase 1